MASPRPLRQPPPGRPPPEDPALWSALRWSFPLAQEPWSSSAGWSFRSVFVAYPTGSIDEEDLAASLRGGLLSFRREGRPRAIPSGRHGEPELGWWRFRETIGDERAEATRSLLAACENPLWPVGPTRFESERDFCIALPRLVEMAALAWAAGGSEAGSRAARRL